MWCSCAKKWGNLAPFILRLTTGLVFLVHGLIKLSGGVAGTAGFLTMLGFPLPGVLAVLLIAGEVLGGAALILGLMTHWAAKVTAFIALVAFFTVHLKNGFLIGAGGYEFIIMLFAASLSLMITGPGAWSIDHKLHKKQEQPAA